MSGQEERQLLEACRSGDLEIVRRLVESKVVDPKTVVDHNTYDMTPLHIASL